MARKRRARVERDYSAPQHQFWQGCQSGTVTEAAFFGGVGAGKSRVSTDVFGDHVLRYGYPGATAALLGPSHKLLAGTVLKEFKRYCREMERVLGRQIITYENNHEKYLVLYNGTTIHRLSARHPEDIQGFTFFAALADELSSYSEVAWQNLCSRMRDTDRPNLLIAATTLRESAPWIKRSFDRPDDPSLLVVKAPTSDDYHWLPAGFRKKLEARMSARRAAQQLDCDWDVVAQWGRIFYAYDEAVHLRRYKPTPTTDIYVAIDFGTNHPHVLFIANDGHPEISMQRDVVFDELAPTGIGTHELCNLIMAKGYQIQGIYADPEAMGAIRTLEERIHCPVYYTRDDILRRRENGYEIVNWRLAPHVGKPRLYFADSLQRYNDRCIRRDIDEIKYAQEPTDGIIRYQEDRVARDCADMRDSTDALRYYCINRYGLYSDVYLVGSQGGNAFSAAIGADGTRKTGGTRYA